MPTMPPDSHKISLKIIESIKRHPVLYINDVKGSVKVQEFRQKVWKRISDELTLDPAWVRLKWKNLRDTYRRILKYKNKTNRGARRKKWIFEDRLSFLKFPYELDYRPRRVELSDEYIQEINNGDTDTDGPSNRFQDKNDDDYAEYLEVLEETSADPVMNPAIESYERLESDARDVNVQRWESENNVGWTRTKFRKIEPKRTNTTTKAPAMPMISDGRCASMDFGSIRSNRIHLISTPSQTTTIRGTVAPASYTNAVKKSTTGRHDKNNIELFFDEIAKIVQRLPMSARMDIKLAVHKIVSKAEIKYMNERSLLRKSKMQRSVPRDESLSALPKLVLVPCDTIDKSVVRN